MVENELPNRSMLWCKSLKSGKFGFVDDCFVTDVVLVSRLCSMPFVHVYGPRELAEQQL